jgi:fructose-1,6-bisphosphatase/inositol monophosphatase family enzyme
MTIDAAELDWLADMLADAAATEILPRFGRLRVEDVRRKSSAADLVTEADERAERLITMRLRERYPEALVLGEEASSADPGLLESWTGADLAFVVDPVDGTFNFASGVPLFGVMLAVVSRGQTLAGIIHEPIGGDWVIGMRGGGAWNRKPNGGERMPLRVAKAAPVAQMIGSVSWQFLPEPLRSTMARNQTKCLSHIGYRCSAHEYRMLAAGHMHFSLYNRLMPWDHLAGALIHAEAGGYAARFDGSAYLPAHLDGGLLAAPDRDSWEALRSALWEA